MSSTYGLICLNHDPGIEIGDHTIDYQPDTMLAVAKDPAGRDCPDHASCDLVVAAYSYPIVRIACPGKTENGAGCRWHNQPHWVETDWLRLLIAAYQAGDAVPEWVAEPFASHCWKRERALRVGPLLGLPAKSTAAVGPGRPLYRSIDLKPDPAKVARFVAQSWYVSARSEGTPGAVQVVTALDPVLRALDGETNPRSLGIADSEPWPFGDREPADG
jgi:hypothetical protein